LVTLQVEPESSQYPWGEAVKVNAVEAPNALPDRDGEAGPPPPTTEKPTLKSYWLKKAGLIVCNKVAMPEVGLWVSHLWVGPEPESGLGDTVQVHPLSTKIWTTAVERDAEPGTPPVVHSKVGAGGDPPPTRE
jgi:hypothetical protein